MVELRQSMDPHSLNIVIEGKHIGFIQWHPDRSPRIIIHEAGGQITIDDIETVISMYRKHRERWQSA